MSARTSRPAALQRGVALISSLLLLIIITILALSMFRGFGTQERIAGNLREKDRALHAAGSAQQYAEWWLLQGSNTAIGAVACAAPFLNANPPAGQGQICNLTPTSAAGLPAGSLVTQIPLPWTIGVVYTPPNMSVTPGVNGPNGDPPYFAPPGTCSPTCFYVADLGVAADAQGEAYQIDAYGYGGTADTVAVVESTYEVQQGVVNRGGL